MSRAHPAGAVVIVPNGAVAPVVRPRLGPDGAGTTATPASRAPTALGVAGAVLARVVLLATNELGFQRRGLEQRGWALLTQGEEREPQEQPNVVLKRLEEKGLERRQRRN